LTVEGQPIEELAAIVASTDDAIVGTREGVITTWNPGAERLYGYRAEEVVGRPITVLLPPELPAGPTDLLERLRSGERVAHFESVRLRKDGARIDVSVGVAPIRDRDGLIVGVATIARDISAQKRAETQLREREEQYRGVFAATTDGLSITDLETGALVDVNPAFCAMHGRGRDEMLRMHPTDFIHPDDHHIFQDFIATVRAGGQFRARARDFRRDGTVFPVEVLGTPFWYGGQPRVLAVVRDVTEEVEAMRLLEDRVMERTRELSTLLEVSRNLVGTLALKPLLGVVLDQLRTVVDYGSAAVLTLEGDELVVQDYRGPRPREEVVDVRIALAGAVVFREVLQGRAPVIIADALDDSELARLFRRRGDRARRAFPSPRSWLGVPLIAKDRMIGMLRLDHPEPARFGERDASLALAIANQAAVAIENARLYEQAHERAATDERQRLARDLHDAVTQTLFSASLIADVLPRVWARDPDEALVRLEEVRQLTRGALAEMRTLLLELRPAALTETGLGELLRHLTEAFVGRARVPVDLEVEGEAAVPPDVQVALYRLAQEALNNAAKHASASRVSVRLRLADDVVWLAVEDDGQGFDASAVGVGHLGLDIMRERCAQIGATLAVDSRPGGGTRIAATWRPRTRAPSPSA
jgi:PAS domain S-box-containing protein